MKKLLLLFAAMLLPLMASAYDLADDKGIHYNIKGDGTLEVDGLDAWTTIADILSDVTIGGKTYRVTSIKAWAFEGRSDLHYLSIPWTVTSIGEYAFIDCGSNIMVNIADPECWCQMQLGNEHASPLSSAGKVLVHDIETTRIDIPETVTAIGKFTFYQCRKINSLNIPSSVKSIGSSAFEDCTGLTALTLSEGLETIGGSAFQGCTGLQTLIIPSTVKTININAIANCSGIREVYCYAENVPDTHADAFDATPTEKSTLHVPANAVQKYRTTWPWSDFKEIVPIGGGGTTTLTDNGIIFALKGDGTLEVTGLEDWTRNADILSDVTINGYKYQVTSIGEYAFQGRDDMEYLSIPWSVKSIGRYAFLNCGSNVTVNIADPESWCKMELGNEYSSPFTCAKKVLVYDRETDRIDIPSGVRSIGKYTFYQCRSITSLNIPATVTSIGSSAFEDCTELTSLTLSEGLEELGGSAFEGCSRLSSLTLPSTIRTISVNAFRNCKGITDVYCYAENVPNTQADAFDATPTEKATLHVPANAVKAYRTSWPWSDFKEIVAIGEEGPDAIMGIKQSENSNSEYYDLTGRKVLHPQKGLNIVRYKDGTMKKIIVK